MEADCQQYYRLDLAEVDFGRASRLAFQLPREARTMRKLHPENNWDWNELLLNNMEYALRVLIWQNSADAHEKHPKYYPKQWLPSFMPKPEKPKKKTEEAAMDISKLKEYLSRPRISAKVEANE